MFTQAIDSDEIYDEDENLTENHLEVIADPSKNGFIRTTYLFTEDSTKGKDWFENMRKLLNFDTRKINQELLCLFVGSQYCIFDDDILSQLEVRQPIKKINLPHFQKLYIYREFDKLDYVIVGIDTAKSLVGDEVCVEIYGYRNFEQIGEFHGRLGSLTKFSELVKFIIDYLIDIMGDRIILAIENNSIGGSIIESLEEDPSRRYGKLIYTVDYKKGSGIHTSAQTKPIMVSEMFDAIIQNPKILASQDLINQLSVIERKSNGTVSAQAGSHDDLFIASAFAAYVKKISSLEFDPKINLTSRELANRNKNIANSIFINAEPRRLVLNMDDESFESYINYYGDDNLTAEDRDDMLMPLLL